MDLSEIIRHKIWDYASEHINFSILREGDIFDTIIYIRLVLLIF